MHFLLRLSSMASATSEHPYANLATLVVNTRHDCGVTHETLARMLGCHDIAEASNRIVAFENGERFDRELLDQMISAFEIPREVLELAWLKDWTELYRRWNRWIDEPISQFVFLATDDSGYELIPIVRHILDYRTGERFASRIARRFNRSACLVFSRRIVSHFDRKGRRTHRVEALPPRLGEPFAEFGGYHILEWNELLRDAAKNSHSHFAITNRSGVTEYVHQ